MSHAKRVIKDNMQNQEYHVIIVAIRRLRTDKTVPQENHGQTMLKMSSILDLKRRMAPKYTEHNDARDRKPLKKFSKRIKWKYFLSLIFLCFFLHFG